MKKIDINHIEVHILGNILIMFISALFISGCKDENQAWIEQSVETLCVSDSNEVRSNVKKALSALKNKKTDQEPFLITAILMQPNNFEKNVLDILLYDENGDALGIGINETYINSDGTETNLNEEYPVFLFRSLLKGAFNVLVKVKIRDSGQLKPDSLWKDYASGKNIDLNKIRDTDYWIDTLPEILISRPESNKVKVEVYLYDKPGNKSNQTKLLIFKKE